MCLKWDCFFFHLIAIHMKMYSLTLPFVIINKIFIYIAIKFLIGCSYFMSNRNKLKQKIQFDYQPFC